MATVTLNRPEARNALSTELIRALSELVGEADGRDDVDVLILTGADPAFCAGLDLKELGRDGGPLKRAPADGAARTTTKVTEPAPLTSGPGADASHVEADHRGRQRRGRDRRPRAGAAAATSSWPRSGPASPTPTPASGVHPLWGLTVLLPQAVGIRRAREMSATGNFVDARPRSSGASSTTSWPTTSSFPRPGAWPPTS